MPSLASIVLFQAAPAPGGGFLGPILMWGLIFVIFYVLVILPQRRQQKQHREMVAALQRGDEVVTAGGLVGEIMGIKENLIQLRTGQATVVVERDRIVRKVGVVEGK